MKSQLLPEGFRDSLPELAVKEEIICNFFLDLMKKNGFSVVKPSLLEFENSLFFLHKDQNDPNSFRVMDPISQKMMGIRSDITPQIARVSCGSLLNSPRPLRLCYSGEVFKVKSNSLNMSRQSLQIGSEIIGIKKYNCENEIITLILEILKKFKISKFFINLTIPTLFDALTKDFNLSENEIVFVKDKFANKNINGLDKVSPNLRDLSLFLLDCEGEVDKSIQNLKKKKFSKNIDIEIKNFLRVSKNIKNQFPELKILVDLLEIDKSEYHTGVAFKFFSENLKELFTGGNYMVLDENCIGFSGFLESLIKESSLTPILKKKILVPNNIFLKKKKEIQKKGYITIQSLTNSNKQKMKKDAKCNNCNFYLFNDKIYKVD